MEMKWSAQGRAQADRHGIAPETVVEVAYSPRSVRVIVADGAALMWLGGPVGAAVVVTADREARTVAAYRITGVRPATDGENQAWEKRQR